MNLIELTQKLITLPSFVDENNNEKRIADFLWSYFNQNLPWMKLEKQTVKENRYNIIATDGKNPRLVFICHMDTVKPNNLSMLNPKVVGNRIYGLGTCDMKGSLATSVKALEMMEKTQGIAFIFDCDEEYYFTGIKKVIEKYQFRPELVICPEPTNLEIVNGCRGVIEIELTVIGKTAHAGTPQNGINAIEKAVLLLKKLTKELQTNDLPELGQTTVNLSSLRGGRNRNNRITIQANAVPDIAFLLLDIRPANPSLKGEEVLKKLEILAKKEKVKIVNEKIKLNYQPYISNSERLKNFEKALVKSDLPIKYQKNLSQGGFYESDLISKAWNCPAINFGPAKKETAHTKDEYVEIDSLKKTKKAFENLIEIYCS